MSEEMVEITRDFIYSGCVPVGPYKEQGVWNKRQLAILGIKWPPRRGWMGRVVGKFITKAAAEEFVSLKGRSKRVIRAEREAKREKLI